LRFKGIDLNLRMKDPGDHAELTAIRSYVENSIDNQAFDGRRVLASRYNPLHEGSPTAGTNQGVAGFPNLV
jgi:hypothetical protein